MINSNIEKLIPELKEVADLFDSSDFFNISHEFKLIEGEYLNFLKIEYKGVFREYRYYDMPPAAFNELEEKRYIKRYAKLSLYKALSDLTGINMPWGALTGIRPTKLAYTELKKTGEYKDFFKNFMLVSDKKLKIVEKILETQKGIYSSGEGLTDFFIGIPFCPTRCRYCSFVSTDIRATEKLIPDYVTALKREISAAKELIKNLRSVYIGGGTPVAIGDEYLKQILETVKGCDTEFTVEAGRPDCITRENLKLIKDYGVTRICVNPQTFNDETLKRIGRFHTAQDVIDKFYLAKEYGFIINTDLIAGLDGETADDFKKTIETTLKLRPDNVTVHTLCLKKGSELKTEESRLSASGINEMVDFAHDRLGENGYKPYYLYRQKYMAGSLENTGYTLNGKACVYNVDVMEEISDNVACGANAVSKFVDLKHEKILRTAAPKDLPTYINKVEKVITEKREAFDDIEALRNVKE